MNHYELAINDLIEHVKADKGITLPWRNDAIGYLRRSSAFIRMGLTSTNRPTPPDMLDSAAGQCICKPGMTDKNCPRHRATA